MFRIGQKIVCVDAPTSTVDPAYTDLPKQDRVYTVRGFRPSGISLWLVEIKSRLDLTGIEAGFYAERFRPVVDRPTDISIFKALLNPTRQTENV